jgi:8-oxo-dGTP diphosphatase
MDFGEVIPGIEYRERDAVYAVILNADRKKVAIMVQNGKGFLPGGGMEKAEEQQVCLLRECVEETGFQINIESYIGNTKQYFQSRQKEYIMNNQYFYAGYFGEYIKPPIEDDHELVWMELDEAKQKLFHSSHFWAVEKTFNLCERS